MLRETSRVLKTFLNPQISESEAEAALSTLSPEERRQRRLEYLMAQVNP